MFRRSSSRKPVIDCYFCNTPLATTPADPRNFSCPECGCRNRYDAQGKILSDEAAMHEEGLNRKSYALRASPSRNSIPTLSTHNPFCHSCRTNQTLQINLLANYLPAPSDPSYTQLLDGLPSYKQSLNVRYPPICVNCAPAVEEDIERKNRMAQTTALGGWLKQTRQQAKTNARRAQVRESSSGFLGQFVPMLRWRFQGLLWVITVLISLGGNLVASGLTSEYHAPVRIRWSLGLLCFYIASRAWSDWDPTFGSIQRALSKGRIVKVQGRDTWRDYQSRLWYLRIGSGIFYVWNGGVMKASVATLLLCVETLLLLLSFTSIHVSRQDRISVRPILSSKLRPSTSRTPLHEPHPSQPVMHHGGIPLSSRPQPSLPFSDPISGRSHSMPVFGQPSMQQSSDAYDEDAEMDWDPSPRARSMADVELRPPTFFPREEPTGLEALFEDWNWLDDQRGPWSKGGPDRMRGREEALLGGNRGLGSWMKGWLSR